MQKYVHCIVLCSVHTPSLYNVAKDIYQDNREIPAIGNEKIVIKFWNFHTLGRGTSIVMAVGKQMNEHICMP